MPPIQILPAPRTDPYAFANRDAFMDMITTIGTASLLKRQRQGTERALDIMNRGGTPQEAIAALNYQPVRQGILGSIGSIFEPDIPHPLQPILTRLAIEQAYTQLRKPEEVISDITKVRKALDILGVSDLEKTAFRERIGSLNAELYDVLGLELEPEKREVKKFLSIDWLRPDVVTPGKLVPKTRGPKKVRPTKIPFKSSIKAQSAPDTRLDKHWEKLSPKQREDIWKQFEQDPASIEAILEAIANATP